jgi:glycosyltransferase involved in cell wall biosynthesis
VKRLINGLDLWRWLQIDLSQKLKSINADVLHCPAFVAPFNCPVPVVISFHDRSFFALPEDKLSGILLRMLTSVAMRRAAGVITVSRSVHDDVVDYYHLQSDRVCVIHHGVSPTYSAMGTTFSPAELRSRFGIHEPFALFVGALSRRKNLIRVLEALSILRQQGQCMDLQLVLAGPSGNDGAHLKRTVDELQLMEQVRILGWVRDEDLPALYRAAEIFVFPSLYEGFGLPILEAMASGTPVLTSATTSPPEIAGDAAVLVDPRDTRAIAQGIARLHEDSALRDRLRSLGIARAATFTWESSASKTVDAYMRAASAQPSRR